MTPETKRRLFEMAVTAAAITGAEQHDRPMDYVAFAVVALAKVTDAQLAGIPDDNLGHEAAKFARWELCIVNAEKPEWMETRMRRTGR